MNVWVLFIDSRVDSLHANVKSALKREAHLKNVNGSQLAMHMQEIPVQGIEETE